MREDAVSFTRAGELLGLSGEEVFDLVFSGQLDSVETSTGRWLVPLAAIEDWKATHPSHA